MAERKYKHPQVNLRIPEDLKEKIAKLAADHGRSSNAEMVDALETWVNFHFGITNESGVSKKLEKPMTIKRDEMMNILQSIQEGVVIQLSKKYNITPKEGDEP